MKSTKFTNTGNLSHYRKVEVSSKWIAISILPMFLVFVFYISIIGFDTYEAKLEPMEMSGSLETRGDSIKVWVKIEGDNVVTNVNGNIFRWPYSQQEVDTSELVNILKEQVQKRQLLSFLRKKDSDNLSVSIIADESLRYMHVIPLIQAMASVGISDYRFLGEKKILK